MKIFPVACLLAILLFCDLLAAAQPGDTVQEEG